MKKETKAIIAKIGVPVALLGLGLLMQFLPESWGYPVTKQQSFFLGCFLCVSGVLIEVLLELVREIGSQTKLIRTLSANHGHNADVLKRIHNDLHTMTGLTEMGQYMKQIQAHSDNGPSVLSIVSGQIVGESAKRLKDIASNLRFAQLDQHHLFIAPLCQYLEDIQGTYEDIWLIENLDSFRLHDDELHWLHAVHNCVSKKLDTGQSCVTRRTIIVVQSEAIPLDPQMKEALRNLQELFTLSGYSARILDSGTYDGCARATHCPPHCDFGLYGRQAAFITESYSDKNPQGVWTINPDEIALLGQQFDMAWAKMESSIERDLGQTKSTMEALLVLQSLLEKRVPILEKTIRRAEG